VFNRNSNFNGGGWLRLHPAVLLTFEVVVNALRCWVGKDLGSFRTGTTPPDLV
jgi:hypothetical protein